MAAAAIIPVEEYLSTGYSPDREYVDGVVVERNLGEFDHCDLQAALIAALRPYNKRYGTRVLPEQRVQVRSTRFRVPDICVLAPGYIKEPIIRHPPFICFEILSPGDRLPKVQDKVNEYLEFGVPYVWVIDPEDRRAWLGQPGRLIEVPEGVLRTENPEIVISLATLFD